MGSRAPHKKPKGRDTRSAKPPHPAHPNSRRQSARKGPTEQRGDRRAAQAQRGQQGAGAAGRPTKAKGRRHTERQATSPRSLKQQKAKRKKPAAQRGNRGAAQRERAASVSRQSNTAQEGQRRRPTGRHGAQRRTARAADRTAAPDSSFTGWHTTDSACRTLHHTANCIPAPGSVLPTLMQIRSNRSDRAADGECQCRRSLAS